MMKGEGDVVAGFMNKIQAAVAAVTPHSTAGRNAPRHGRARLGLEAAVGRLQEQRMISSDTVPDDARRQKKDRESDDASAVRAVTIGQARAKRCSPSSATFTNLARFMENIERIDVLDDQALALGGEGAGRPFGGMGLRDHRGRAGPAAGLGQPTRTPRSRTTAGSSSATRPATAAPRSTPPLSTSRLAARLARSSPRCSRRSRASRPSATCGG